MAQTYSIPANRPGLPVIAISQPGRLIMGRAGEHIKPRILITGSKGMLGTDLCQELSGDYEVFGMDVVHRRGDKLSSTVPPRRWNCDVTNKQEVLQVVKKIRPDIVIHAAAMTDVDGCELDPDRAYRINS